MAIGRYYTMEFDNVEQTFCKVLIGDSSIQSDSTPEIIPLEPTDTPVFISTIDEGENKFTPVKSQQVTISFFSNNATSLQTFSDGPDDRFSVTVLYGTTIVFYGFLSLEDNTEAFLPPRNIVTLTANDKLGALKEIPLTDNDGENPQGKYTIGNLIAFCLRKTGLDLQIRVLNNLRHGSGALSYISTFNGPPVNSITVPNTDFFYVGQVITITDTVSNNITFTVTSVTAGVSDTVIISDEDLVTEVSVNATFTDATSTDHIYKGIYLDAKTFEAEIGVSEDCYTVLEKILGYDCFLTQYKECWWICRVDEYDANAFYVSRFDENGNYIDSYIEPNLNKTVGFAEQETFNDEDINVRYFSEEETKILPTRPIGIGKLTYNFNNPIEIICNEDFERGEFVEDLPDETNGDGTVEQVKKYTLDCWDWLTRAAGSFIYDNFGNAPLGSADVYIKKFYFDDTETHRELVIKASPGSSAGVTYVQSNLIPVSIKDKINLSASVSYSNIGSSSGFINSPVLVALFADNGDIYWWRAYNTLSPDADQEWALIPSGNLMTNGIWYAGAAIDDSPLNMSFTSPPLPASGNIRIFLVNEYGDEINAHYEDVKLSVTPFINGSYQRYKGHYNKVERVATGYLATIDDEVFISDSQRELFKGAMFFLSNAIYELTSRWYDASKFALGNPTLDRIKPYGNLQAYSVWNQYRLANIIFQFRMQGFGADIPSLVHKFSISDISWASNDRYFIMLTKDADIKNCTMSGVLQECYRISEGKSYDDPHEFKYIS